MNDAIRKAGVLIEALSYIRGFRDRVTVIKLGGSAMEEADTLRATLQDVVFMETVGMRPVLVHGGGRAIDRAMEAAGLEVRKVQGRRYTDDRTLDVVVRVLVQEINAGIVRQIRDLGGRAVGLHSEQLQCLFGRPLLLSSLGQDPVNLGRVGQITHVDQGLIQDFCAAGVVPVIPSLAFDNERRWLNVNADTAAAAVAGHLKAEKLVLLTDTPGILEDRADESTLISSLDADRCRQLIGQGVIEDGMIPKVEACLESLEHAVRKTHIIDGRLPHSLLLEIYTDRGIGTEIRAGATIASNGGITAPAHARKP
jgi:acetylglutamate kinase